VKSGFETFRLDAQTIQFLQKDGNYMFYHCDNQKIIARETIQESLQKLPITFMQTHKSYIVNIKKIVSYDKNTLNMGKDKIPVSESF
jgi:DNA-binding LytR/AlgR family response regulator